VVPIGAVKKKSTKKYLRGPDLVALADSEPRQSRPRDFLPAVDKLRDKGFTWRACAKWLEAHAGIEISHTTLMRVSQDRELMDPLEGEES
jgi:hypothetical protein